MKNCSTCTKSKPLKEFYKDKRTTDGLYSNCKICHKKSIETSQNNRVEIGLIKRPDHFNTCTCGNSKWRNSKVCTECKNKVFHKNKHGYLIKQIDGKYTLQHRLVMEAMLGRLLLPGENVHHKNGVRSDNRIENLELWVSHQPSGQRVEDLIEWAEEILRRYK